jgi:hypothetical protein
MVVTGAYDGILRAWCLATGRLIAEFDDHATQRAAAVGSGTGFGIGSARAERSRVEILRV